jgi:hypothetical protein
VEGPVRAFRTHLRLGLIQIQVPGEDHRPDAETRRIVRLGPSRLHHGRGEYASMGGERGTDILAETEHRCQRGFLPVAREGPLVPCKQTCQLVCLPEYEFVQFGGE